eukprot:364722-Chlamydomonas_euryale.AAC.5
MMRTSASAPGHTFNPVERAHSSGEPISFNSMGEGRPGTSTHNRPLSTACTDGSSGAAAKPDEAPATDAPSHLLCSVAMGCMLSACLLPCASGCSCRPCASPVCGTRAISCNCADSWEGAADAAVASPSPPGTDCSPAAPRGAAAASPRRHRRHRCRRHCAVAGKRVQTSATGLRVGRWAGRPSAVACERSCRRRRDPKTAAAASRGSEPRLLRRPTPTTRTSGGLSPGCVAATAMACGTARCSCASHGKALDDHWS